MKKWW